MPDLHISGDPDADALISRDPLSLLLAMLLDQQVPMEKAFKGPTVLRDRMGTALDGAEIAERDDIVELLARFKALPGFGEQKAKIFLALLGKQLGVQPVGWREAAGAYGDDGARRSIADVTSPETLKQVRAYKREMKVQARHA